MLKSCVIVGGGIAGISAALSLAKIGIQCTVYELRAAPSTIGGSVNLTPNALKLLDYLDVELEGYGCRVDSIEIFSLHTGQHIGELACRKFGPSLRISREELLQALLLAAGKSEISVVYDSKLVSIKDESDEDKVTAVFANGKAVQADFILGCDGIHSAVRSQYVEPSRELIYTNVAVAYSIVDGTGIETHFQQTAMNSGRFGSLLTAYVDPDQTRIYLGAVMEIPDEKDRQGWKVCGNDRQKTLDEISRRFKASANPCINELVERVEDVTFYPVYNLGPGGVWSRGRVLLLGDAAHGVSCSSSKGRCKLNNDLDAPTRREHRLSN